jgi:hypothetical protein
MSGFQILGTQPHAQGKPQTRAHHQPSGQNASIMPNPWNIPFPIESQISVTEKSPCGQVDSLLDTRPL